MISFVRSHAQQAPDDHATCWEFIPKAYARKCVLGGGKK